MATTTQRFRDTTNDTTVTGNFIKQDGVFKRALPERESTNFADIIQNKITTKANTPASNVISIKDLSQTKISKVVRELGILNSPGIESAILGKLKSYPSEVMKVINDSILASVDNVTKCLNSLFSTDAPEIDINSLGLVSVALLDCAVIRGDDGQVDKILLGINNEELKQGILGGAVNARSSVGDFVGASALLSKMSSSRVAGYAEDIGGTMFDTFNDNMDNPRNSMGARTASGSLDDASGSWQMNYGIGKRKPFVVSPIARHNITNMQEPSTIADDVKPTLDNTKVLLALL